MTFALQRRPAASPPEVAPEPPWWAVPRARALAVAAAAVLLGQLVLLVERSWAQWSAGALSLDFAIFHQAWSQIAAGDLSPWVSVGDYPYWQSHFEVMMWPLALLGIVFPSGFTLLVVQDLAIVGAQALAVLWALEAASRRPVGRWWWAVPPLLVLGLLLTNPHVYRAATSDFHFQALATFFVVGAARSLWRGSRRTTTWAWVVAALLTGDVAGTYVVGLGLSALVARRDTRRTGALLVLAGVGWVAFAALLGANRGSQIGGYGHLVGRELPDGAAGAFLVLGALLLHPDRPLAVLWDRAPSLLQYFGGSWLALLHPWTFGVVLVVLGTNALHSATIFSGSSFQNLPVVVLGALAAGLLADWLRRRAPARPALAGGAVAAVVVATAVWRPEVEPPLTQPAAAAEAVSQVETLLRPDDQVVASFGIVGRFADRPRVEWYLAAGSVIPVQDDARVVVVLSPTVGNMPTPPDQRAAAASLAAVPGAQRLVDTPHLTAWAWEPPPGTTQITLPVVTSPPA
jgi:hypothetical protein